MAITKIILQQMVTMDQNSVTASKYPKYTIVLGNTISSITAAELTSAIESSKASAAAAKQSEINAKQSELNAKDSENEAEISAASSQQSATQSASSATASANSAKAAKTSETNAKASETAAKTSETNAKASETAAKASETNAKASETAAKASETSANNSKTAAAASASAAKTSETNAAASASAAKTSETNAKASETATANSAKAAKTSETNAAASASDSKASRDEAGTFATQATNAAAAARESQTSANNSANIASQAVTTIQGLKDTAVSAASQAETSAQQASTHASAASSSAATAKTEANKAKVEADRAKAEADRASANSYTISFSGGAGWFKLATVTMPQSTSTVSIKMVGGKGYNANSPQQAGITELVLRAGNGNPKGLSGSLWRRTTEGFSSMAWINTSGNVYDVYVEIGNYATAVNIQVNYTTNASVVLHSQPQYYATKPEGLTTCTIYDLYNPLLPPPDDGTSLKKAQNLSDLQDKAQARTNLDLDRFRQFVNAGETQVKCADGTKQIFIKNTGDWGAWDSSRGLSLALPIVGGGTGGQTIPEAQRNLLIPDSGLDRVLVLRAPAGAESNKYYPIIIHQPEGFDGNFLTEVEMTTPSRVGAEDPNCNTLRLWVRSGGWSDRGKVAFANFFAYMYNEVAILCVRGSLKGQQGHNAIYVRGDGFPVYLRKTPRATVTVPTSDWSQDSSASDKCIYKWGIENAQDGIGDEYGCGNQLNFSNGLNGFYCNDFFRDGNGNPFLKHTMDYGGDIVMTIGKLKLNGDFETSGSIKAGGNLETSGSIKSSGNLETSGSISSEGNLETSGSIKSNGSFIAEGIDVSGFTYRSTFLDGATTRNAEFRAASVGGEIVIRDPSGGTDHKFFGFGYDGSLSLMGAIKPGQPVSIAYGGTGATDANGIRNNIGLNEQHSPTFSGLAIKSGWPAVVLNSTNTDETYIGRRIYAENNRGDELNVFFARESDNTDRRTVVIERPNTTERRYVAFDGGLANGGTSWLGYTSSNMNEAHQGWRNWGGTGTGTPQSGNVYGSLFTQCTQGLLAGRSNTTGTNGKWYQQRFYDTSNRIYTRVQTNAASWGAWAQVTTSAVSDERVKDVLGNLDVECALSNIDRMEFKLFKFKEEHHTKEIRGATRRGVISQQIKQIDREYVKDVGGYWHLDQTPMLLDGLAAIQALSHRDRENKERITALESEVSDLRKQIADLTLVVNSLLANKA